MGDNEGGIAPFISSQTQAASAEAQRFWEVLPSVNIDAADGMLRLPEGIFTLGDPTLPRLIYARPKVYSPLYDLVRAEEVIDGAVLTGTSGIGKTCFLYYVLWRLSVAMAAGEKNGAPSCVVFERQYDESKCRYLFRTGMPVLVGSRDDFATELQDAKCL